MLETKTIGLGQNGREAKDRGAAESAFRLSVSEGIARLVFDLPGKKVNVLSSTVMEELDGLIGSLAQRRDVRCLVVESGKPGVFIAGADLREFEAITDSRTAERMSAAGQEIYNRIADLPFPTIAVIDGAAAGGGLELALACDYRLATDNPRTQLSLPETTLGLLPGWGGTYRLPRLIGLIQALQLILPGKAVDGVQAARIRLADACYPSSFIRDKTEEFVRAILAPAGGRAVQGRRKKKRLSRRLAEGTPIGRAIVFGRARAGLAAKGGKHYPGLEAALQVLRKTVHASRARALEAERRAIGLLLPTSVCKNLVRLYFAREAVKKSASPRDGGPPRTISRAAVLGAGTMGGRIAWLFTRNDTPVVLKDLSWDAVRKGYASAYEVYRELKKRRRYDERQINLKMHRLSGAVDYVGLGRPDFVVEAVFENLEVKKKVLAEVEAHIGPEAILASNTSSLSITDLAAGLRHPERFLGLHFFNPPNLMPLVEIVPGPRTGEQTIRDTASLALALGKTPIVVRDRPGFLVNRLLMPYLTESTRLVDEGCDYRKVDRLLQDFGLPMGPFALLDEIGIDIAIEVAGILGSSYGGRMEPPALFAALKGRRDLLGRKSGRGFYVYSGKSKSPNPEMLELAAKRRRQGESPDRFDIVHRPILAMLNEAARALEEGAVASAQELDLALVLGVGFPPFRGGILRYADELGLRRVRDTLARFAGQLGDRFAPAPLIEKLAAGGEGFYPAH
jgi:3-hydroxyacyl-CoA dehydrogenase/enoyl-CoA hydratase/3-hydroxybutyryl-CoA epimerase